MGKKARCVWQRKCHILIFVSQFMELQLLLLIYSSEHVFILQLYGFLGGIHLAILTAYVCQLHPNATTNVLLAKFFDTFAHWQWPTPVALQEETISTTSETRPYMPIRLPCSPYNYCHSNITRSTYYRIRTEFLRGYKLTSVCYLVPVKH